MTILQSQRLLKAIIATAMFTFSVCAAAADESPRDLCSLVNFTGTYRTRLYQEAPREYQPIKMTQLGCIVTVTDPNPPAKIYNFDLSGEQEFNLPEAVLQGNSGSEFAYKSLKSVRGTTTLARESHGPIIVKVAMTMDLPKSSENTFENTLSIEGDLTLSGYASVIAGTTKMGSFQMGALFAENVKYRVIKVDHPVLVGPLNAAFLSGVNYVLHFFDKIDIMQVVGTGIFPINSATN